jgi:hypothetical protein
MFCPKCGLQNADEIKFCRACGADLSNVLAVVDGKSHSAPALTEKYIDLLGSGLRGVLIGIGFLIVSSASFAISMRFAVLGLFLLAIASFFVGTGISRLIQAKAIKALNKGNEPPALPSAQTDYIKPTKSIYETEDLTALPFSVTDHTTRQLKNDD